MFKKGDPVYVVTFERWHGDNYTPAVVTETAKVYCRVKAPGHHRANAEKFHIDSGFQHWPANKGGMPPHRLITVEEYERRMAARAAEKAAAKTAEREALETLRSLGVELREDRDSRITATAMLVAVRRLGVGP